MKSFAFMQQPFRYYDPRIIIQSFKAPLPPLRDPPPPAEAGADFNHGISASPVETGEVANAVSR